MPRLGGTFSDSLGLLLAILRDAAGRRDAGRAACRLGFFPDQPSGQALYGPLGEGQQRIDAWQRLLASQKQVGEQEQLNVVNLFFNKQMRYVEDIDLWHAVDYWETPIEALWKGAGDCEDYAIAKYFSLRHLGVSSDKLRITYVKALRLNRAHMVLTYYSTPEAMPLVLDSLMDDIQPASQRTDLLPVYSFNAEGSVPARRQGQQEGR